jgi:hypothetical protein
MWMGAFAGMQIDMAKTLNEDLALNFHHVFRGEADQETPSN